MSARHPVFPSFRQEKRKISFVPIREFRIVRFLLLILFTGVWMGYAVAQTDRAPSFPRSAKIGDLVFEKGVPIDEIILPVATSGNIDPGINAGELSDYSFDPAKLPPGLNFDRFTRVLSGTPKYSMKQRTYHLWVHDDDENWSKSDGASLSFTIEVVSEKEQNSAGRTAKADNDKSAPARFAVSFESEFQWFNRDKRPRLSGVTRWNSVVWKGERIQKQILVTRASPRDRISVAAGDFEGPAGIIPADAVTFRYPQFVKGDIEARDCEGYPERDETVHLSDALFPQQPRKQTKSYPMMYWMSVDIPENTRPGEYAGSITVNSTSGEKANLQVAFQVTPWTMPTASERRFHLDLWQFPVSVLDRYNDANGRKIKIWSEEHYALLEPTYRYLAELGQRTVTTYIKEGAFAAPSMIRWIALEGGKRWEYDYSVFDAHVERLAGWGIDDQISAFSPVGWNKDELPFRDEATGTRKVFKYGIGSKEYNALWNHFLTDFKEHLVEKGWFEKTVLYMDEVPKEEMEAVIRLIRFNDKDWKIGLAYGHAPGDNVIASLYDVSGYYENETGVQTYPDQVTTFYTSCSLQRPNNYVAADGNPADMTAMPWYAMYRGHDGYLRWAFDNWRSYEPLDLQEGSFTAGDFSFVYRSSNKKDMTMIPSVRSELLRDGIEDYEKVQVLHRAMLNCKEEDLLADLEEVVNAFSTERLMAGQASELIALARTQLLELSQSLTPDLCQ